MILDQWLRIILKTTSLILWPIQYGIFPRLPDDDPDKDECKFEWDFTVRFEFTSYSVFLFRLINCLLFVLFRQATKNSTNWNVLWLVAILADIGMRGIPFALNAILLCARRPKNCVRSLEPCLPNFTSIHKRFTFD